MKHLFAVIMIILTISIFISCQPTDIDTISGDEPLIDTTPPIEVSNLNTSVADRTITLTWEDPSDEDLDKIMVAGELLYTEYINKGVEGITLENVHNGLEYDIIVKTIDEAGNISDGISVFATPVGSTTSPHIGLCDDIASNWAGIFLNYETVANFMNECELVKNYSDDMEMLHQVRPFVNDGHFYIGLEIGDPLNDYDNAFIIPLVVTEAKNQKIVIAKSKDHLRSLGLKEGNIIRKINGIDVYVYIDQLMELFPQSSEYESKEKATRILFSTIRAVNSKDHYFEIPIFDGVSPRY
jgi:hypothetical protein